MNTLYAIIGLFAIGAIFGMYLLTVIIQKKETQKFVVAIHGLFVAVALVMLILYNINHPGLLDSIILFIIAAAGGAVLFVKDIMGKPIPKWLAFVHGLVAVAGFIVLLGITFSK